MCVIIKIINTILNIDNFSNNETIDHFDNAMAAHAFETTFCKSLRTLCRLALEHPYP